MMQRLADGSKYNPILSIVVEISKANIPTNKIMVTTE